MSPISVAVLGALLLVSSQVIAADPEPPKGSTELTAEELAARLKDNTFSHPTIDGARVRRITFQGDVAYATMEGVAGQGRGRNVSGKWQTKGSSFCISFPVEEECHEVRLSGNDLYTQFKTGWIRFTRE